MIGSSGRIVALLLALLTVVGAVTAFPAFALEPDSGSTLVSPSAPGGTGDLRAVVVAEQGDNITRNGLKQVTLDFSADPDYSGSIAGITARDTEVRVTAPSGNGTLSAGPVRVSANPAGDRIRVTLLSAYRNVQPGDEITVRLDGVRNPEIAISDPQGPRGFALAVSASGPQGNTDGPVEVRYSIDPNATATPAAGPNATNATGANGTGNDSNATAPNASNVTGNATNATGPNATSPNATNATGVGDANAETTATASTTTTTATTTQTTTATTTETTTTAAATSTAAETTGGSGATETTTTGPGFGLLAAVIALLAAALLATRRRG